MADHAKLAITFYHGEFCSCEASGGKANPPAVNAILEAKLGV